MQPPLSESANDVSANYLISHYGQIFFLSQLANALEHLSTLGLIHTDIKMENVMLVNHEKEPFRVKLIDFSLAMDVSAVTVGSNLQTPSYR